MQPQIVAQDIGGRHNNDLDASRGRIIRGASWKKQRVVCVMPAADLISAKVCLSLWSLVFPPNQAAHRMIALGMEVGDAYSATFEQIAAHPDLGQWEYIFTCEHDNILPCDTVIKLIETMETHPEYCAVSALYWTKGEGGQPQCWGDPTDANLNFRPIPPRVGEVIEVNGIGMGAAIWRMKTFKDKRFPRPFFKTKAGREGVGTQDLSFAGEAKKLGYRFAVDCRVLVGHYDYEGKFGPPDTVW